METDPTRIAEILVGLPAVNLSGVDDVAGEPLLIHIETRTDRPVCPRCSGAVLAKDRDLVELVDLAAFGRPVRLIWKKRRFKCADRECPAQSFTEVVPEIARPGKNMTDRAGRWVTEQVGRPGRTVAEVATELGCDWHTINDTVVAYGGALIDDDPDRIGDVLALGLDETLFARQGPGREEQPSLHGRCPARLPRDIQRFRLHRCGGSHSKAMGRASSRSPKLRASLPV